jgi:hypothetical protein
MTLTWWWILGPGFCRNPSVRGSAKRFSPMAGSELIVKQCSRGCDNCDSNVATLPNDTVTVRALAFMRGEIIGFLRGYQ